MLKLKRVLAIILCLTLTTGIACVGCVFAAAKYTVSGSYITAFTGDGGDESPLPASVVFTEQGGRKFAVSSTETDGIGSFSAEVASGVYSITITKPGYLPYTVGNVRVVNRDIAIPELAVLPGDLNADGCIDTKDLAVFLRGFQSDEKYGGIRKLADFDADGTLTVTDLAALKPNTDKSKETYEWTNVMKLQTDYRNDPLGIDFKTPEFNWALESTKRGEKQTAYRIGVASTFENAVEGDFDVWDSGIVESSETKAVYGEISSPDGTTPTSLLPQTE